MTREFFGGRPFDPMYPLISEPELPGRERSGSKPSRDRCSLSDAISVAYPGARRSLRNRSHLRLGDPEVTIRLQHETGGHRLVGGLCILLHVVVVRWIEL